MIGKNLILVFRRFQKSPILTLINILCLSAGMASILFISIWIRDELSYDRFHKNHENIYRLTIKVDDKEAGYHSHFARSYYSWLYELKDKVPGINDIARLNYKEFNIIKTPTDEAFRSNIIMSDSSIFSVFSFKFLEGSASSAFKKPSSIILSRSAASKYFGTADPLGQTLELYCDRCVERKPYTVSAIVEDYPTNSHFHFDIIGTIDDPENFSQWAYYYLKLEENIVPEELIKNFETFAAEYVTAEYAKNLTPFLQNIGDIHLNSHKDREIEENGNYQNIWLFLGLSIFVLFVSLFNFLNVRQVSLVKSGKSLNVMRIHGAGRRELLIHQILEVFILSFIAVTIAVMAISMLIPGFNAFTGKEISLIQIWANKEWWIILGSLMLFSVITGVLPFLFSGLREKGRVIGNDSHSTNTKKLRLTRFYVALQFAASLVLIITVLVVNRQLNYFMVNRLGSKNDKILCIKNMPVQVMNNYQIFKAELLKNPLIQDITSSFENPADENMDMMSFETTNVSDDVKNKNIFVYPADHNFFDFYSIKVIAGSGFPVFSGNDTLPEAYILNKKACDYLGWKPEEAIDRPFKFKFEIDGKNLFTGGRIVGVVEDFQMSSMKNEIKPYVFFQKSFWMESVQVKYDTSQSLKAFEAIKAGFEKSFPGHPFEYEYVEDLYQKIYKNENQLKSLSSILGILAILLSSLGLWGITGIIYQSKTKEIGIRKVNGAHKTTIILWLLKDINLILLVSIIIGIPVAYILMRDWLIYYPLHVSLQWWMFVTPALLIYFIAILTVFWQANRAAGMNPVESLKYE